MGKMLKRHRLLILTMILTTALLIGLGYFFAEKQSEPEFASKIDRIMFERKNKSPKFVITLPDAAARRAEILGQQTQDKLEEQNQPTDENNLPKGFSAAELAAKIPLTAKLTPIANPTALNPLEIIPDLSEEKNGMILPKISGNGQKPWIEYAKTENVQPNFYKVAIVLKNLGMDSMITTAAIETMPANISLSFSPYGRDLSQAVRHAREFGHETYVDWLLCSQNFLKADSGPMAMSITQNKEENLRRAEASLNVRAPIGGMVVSSGIADDTIAEHLLFIMQNLQKRGLLIVDATGEDGINQVKVAGLPRRKADIVIDTHFVRKDIDEQLKMAESIAKNNGSVLIAANPKPVVLHALKDWVETFSPQLTYDQMKEQQITPEKPLVLVPVSNLVVE